MNSKFLVISIAVLLAVAFIDAKKVKGKGKKAMGFKCLGEDIKFDNETMAAVNECKTAQAEAAKSEDDDEEDEDKEEKIKKWKDGMACVTECSFRKLGVITSDGKLDSDKIEASIKSVYPSAAHDAIIADERKCVKLITEKISTDDNCKSIKEYTSCHIKAVFSNCKKADKKDKEDKSDEE